MKKMRFLLTGICLVFLSTVSMAQNDWSSKMKKNIDEQVVLTAKDLGLTSEQQTKLAELIFNKFVLLNDELKKVTTEEDKAVKRKEAGQIYSKKLEDAFGAELALKIRKWQAEYATKKQAEKTKQ